MKHSPRATALAFALLILPVVAGAATRPSASPVTLTIESVPRIADPKLEQGAIPIRYKILPIGVSANVQITVEKNAQTVASVFSGNVTGSDTPVTASWNGKLTSNKFADPGDYSVRIIATAGNVEDQSVPLSIVRLGITGIEALPVNTNDEWQMVYFLKGPLQYAFYATPAIHEYFNVKKPGEVSDLDLNNGNPRPSVSLHEDLQTPPLNGVNYEAERYNFPICYVVGRVPRFRATFGTTATSEAGSAVAPGYPVSGYEIRATLSDALGAWTSSTVDITPGGSATFDGPPVANVAKREDRVLVWKYEYRTAGGGAYEPVPGQQKTRHRFYTIVNRPIFATGASGTQYAGPWVMVTDLVYTWATKIGITMSNEAEVLEAVIKGFFGQVGDVRTAIMGCNYDCPSMGGDGGATHYFDFGSNTASLSRLLNFKPNGQYINCSDVASSTSTMSAMLGVRGVQLVRLGFMQLKAIWGIGTPAYTTNLWGTGHSFSYHHIITRNAGVNVSDACMCIDEDGNPNATPGLPGWNVDRIWAGAGGYMALSASNNVSKVLESLPKLQ